MKLEVLKDKCTSCVKCTLSTTRKNVVFGRGNPNSDLFVIGEGPGQQEDAQGLAFVGRSGKMLDDIFLSAGIDTNKDCYISNIVKCRTPNNRKPTINEVSECMPWLTQQIDLIKPNIIVLAGSTAVGSYLGIKEPISQLRGRWIIKENIKYMPIFHPSYLLRNPSIEKGKPKWLTVKDIKKVKKEL
jgi:DNA polymerase